MKKQFFAVNAALPAMAVVLLVGCSGPRQNAVKYQTAAVAAADIQQRVTASGTLSAVISVDVGSQVSGKIAELMVDYNSPVKKGQIVARIDPTVYRSQLNQAEGELTSARAVLQLKKLNLQRKKVLEPLHGTSQADIDSAEAEAAQAEASVTIKEAAVKSAQANLGYCDITAPVDGIVVSRKVDAGQTVIAAMSTPVLFTIAQDLRNMNITADVSEADIGQVQVGNPVDFTVYAFPNETFHGKVAQVRRSPTSTQNVVTYQTLISVSNPQNRLFPGMTADVSILVAERSQVAAVPNGALRYSPPTGTVWETPPPTSVPLGTQLLYVVSADKLRLRAIAVKPGITDGRNTEVSGVDAGAAVVVSSSAGSGAGFGAFPGPPGQ